MGSNARGSKKTTSPAAKVNPRSDADLPKSLPTQEGLKTSFEGPPEVPARPQDGPTKKNRVGRPSKFNSPEEVQAIGDAYFLQMDQEKRPPTITGLAIALGTYRDVLIRYQEKEEYYNVIKSLKERVHNFVEERLMGNSPTGAIFWLKNYGWHDTQQTIFPDKDGNPQAINPTFNNTERAARMIFMIEQATKRKGDK